MDELHCALREHGIISLHEVALAVLEVDGTISCLKYDEIKPTAATRRCEESFCRNISNIAKLLELQQNDLRLCSYPQRRPPGTRAIGRVHQKISQTL